MKTARSFYFSLIIIFLSVFPSLVQARFWRFNLGALALKSDYTEVRPTQNFLDKDFNQTAAGIQAEFEWNFIPKWFTFNFEVDYATPVSTSSPIGDEYEVFDQVAQIAWTLPARPLNLALVVEQNYNEIKTNSALFGYDNFNAIQAFPQIDFTTPGGFMTIFGKIPLVNLLETEKKEFSYGVIFRFGDKSAAWPEYYFIPGWVLKAEFREIEIIFDTAVRPVTIKTKNLGISLSYNF